MDVAGLEYTDYVSECDRLSRELRLCGVNLIIALASMIRATWDS